MQAQQIVSSKTLGTLAGIALLLVMGGASQAGTEVQAGYEHGKAAQQEEKRGQINLPRSNLRCWQEGKLLFEETEVNERSLKQARQVLVFDQERKDAAGEIYLIESGSATCLYKKA